MPLIIAGERSGVGKTTITLALLAALKHRNIKVQSFKVGPDYIDPMFHRHVTGRACRNLDPMLTSEVYVQKCFNTHAQKAKAALVEGVMGLFDGAVGQHQDFASTAHIARLLNLPIALVLDCSRLSHSIAALVHGYRSLDPRVQFAGVVLNRVGSDRHLELLKSSLEPLQVPILGVVRRQEKIQIPDRHLGLVPTGELEGLDELIDQLANLGEICFDWSRLMPLLETDGVTDVTDDLPSVTRQSVCRIAVAQDAAFNFYYADNLELLEQLGAELVPWSPLKDTELPKEIHGLYLGGGFPEMFAQTLSENHSARNAVHRAIHSGMPTYAECGGLMYLCQGVVDFADQPFEMVGVLPTTAVMGPQLTLGYRHAIALQNTSIVRQGAIVCGHEFHRSRLTVESENPLFELKSSSPTPEGWHLANLHASYLHLHWGGSPELPDRFIRHCQSWQIEKC